MKIGMIGTGWFADMHCDLLEQMEGVQVAAVCGTSQAKAEHFASQRRNAASYADVEEMLEQEKLDAVYICVPPFAHGAIERAVVARQIPFFIEKPIALDEELPAQIQHQLQQSGLITSVGYHFRYTDGAEKLLELLKGRTVGMALGTWLGDMPRVAWWRKQEGSGGQFLEQTTHIVDLLRYTLGEVTEVYAATALRHMNTIEEGVTVDDVGTVTLKLASGAVANISNTCMLPKSDRSGLQIYTDLGVLEVNHNGVTASTVGQNVTYHNQSNPYIKENEAFIHAVRTGDTQFIRSTYADAILTQRIATAALRSAQSGLPVVL
ncbi:oxidoreductase [Paenibacillus selenitireducens]|uniref:Oxidoreductase n=1 Tax=Paenibacillus selenitireducens TaxID=1324314 RepID=A0A1T2X374_9BACL|nr:Gfo/Idh/MocA family oxidoreductase [Paenibacillus selenitireducens]OPA74309.1 oxidoreductase [Paenibacillus selenitireducens]